MSAQPSGLRREGYCFFAAPPRRWPTLPPPPISNQRPARPLQMSFHSWNRTPAAMAVLTSWVDGLRAGV